MASFGFFSPPASKVKYSLVPRTFLHQYIIAYKRISTIDLTSTSSQRSLLLCSASLQSPPMADAKQQVHLNGAYYGPPVPPRQRSYRSVGRSSGCCCGPFCLICNLFKFLLSLVIFLGVVVLVLWLVFRPNQPKARVDTASLVQFDLTNSTLRYNLALDLTVRNPNRRLSFYYDRLEARAEYDGDGFGFDSLPTFYQGHKNTTVIGPILFDGSQQWLGDSVRETYSRERGEGFYYIDVKVRAKMRVKVWIFKLRYNRPHIDCTLKLPVPGTSGTFESTGCDVHIF